METTTSNNKRRVRQVIPDHQRTVFRAMNRMRLNGQLCDVNLIAGTETITAHKVVLAACSAYFHDMLNSETLENDKTTITIHDFDFAVLQLFVEFAYTGEILISEENVRVLLSVASLLQIPSVREACCEFMLRQLHPSNCLGIRSFAEAHSCKELLRKSHEYVLENFEEVAATEEFLKLTFCEVQDLISSDQLNVVSEEIVYQAMVTWIRHDCKNREMYLGKLLHHIRFPLVGRNFLVSQVATEPLLQSSHESKDLLIEAMKYHLLPEQRNNMVKVRTTYMKPDGLRPYIFVVCGPNFKDETCCVGEYYNPRTDRWSPIASTSNRRWGAGVASVGRLVYAVGGCEDCEDLSSAESYNPLTNSWTPVTPMGTKRRCLGVASLNGLLYVAGGHDGASCLNSVERYDQLVATWSSVAAMNTRRKYCRLGVLGGAIYAVGGHDGVEYLSTVERFDPREGKWQYLPPMTTRRSGCGVAALDGMLYVVGGDDDGLDMTSNVERFDPVKGEWVGTASMNTRRACHGVVETEGYLYAIGGYSDVQRLNTVERYNPRDNEWIFLSSMSNCGNMGATVLQCSNLEILGTGGS